MKVKELSVREEHEMACRDVTQYCLCSETCVRLGNLNGAAAIHGSTPGLWLEASSEVDMISCISHSLSIRCKKHELRFYTRTDFPFLNFVPLKAYRNIIILLEKIESDSEGSNCSKTSCHVPRASSCSW